MRVELGARVWTRDDQDAGTIDRLILDPASGDVKAIVLRRGGILPDDVEVSVMSLETDAQGRLRLPYTADQIDQLPVFLESNYTSTPPAGYIPPTGVYPGAGLYWPVGYGMVVPPYPVVDYAADEEERRAMEERFRQQDLENALVSEGSDVKTWDGEKVGEVHRLVFDSASGHLTRLVVRRGFFFSRDFELPVSVIQRADDGVLYLRVHADRLQAWTSVARGMEVWSRDGVQLGTIAQPPTDALDISTPGDEGRLRVPITAVDRLDERRVVLAVEAARVTQWRMPPGSEPPVHQTEPRL